MKPKTFSSPRKIKNETKSMRDFESTWKKGRTFFKSLAWKRDCTISWKEKKYNEADQAHSRKLLQISIRGKFICDLKTDRVFFMGR